MSQLSGLGQTVLQLSGLEWTVLQLLDKSVLTAQCYSSILFRRQQENPSSRREGTQIQRQEEKSAPALGRERELALALLFICFSLLGRSYVNWASQECGLFYLRSSLQSSDLLLFHFHGLFPSLSCSHRHFGLLFPVYLPTYGNCKSLKSKHTARSK